MFGLNEIQQTRVYQEAKLEGKLESIPKFLQQGFKCGNNCQRIKFTS